MTEEAAGRTVPPLLFAGFAVAAIGGPLALASVYATGAAGAAVPSIGLVALTGAVLAAFPLLVWLRYSEDIVSAGGLAAFVEAAAGRRLALVQAAVWSFSYFLYLSYTVKDVVYEMLPVVFPGIHSWRPVLEVAVPIGLVGLVLAGLAPVLWALLISAVAQLALMLALGTIELSHHGAARSSFTHVPGAHAYARGSANVALLFVCGSLPLFLGAEARGGKRTVRGGLAAAWAIVGIYLLYAVFPLARVPNDLRFSALPGYSIASAYSGRTLAILVGLGAAVSVSGVIVAEYIALSRLLHSVLRVPVRRLLLWIGVPFVAADALSLINPDGFDHKLIRPSLTALFVSQLIVFALFPLYRARRARLGAGDIVIAAVAFALMTWGLYRALAYAVAT